MQSDEYGDLIRDYLERGEFREAVEELADGLGLYVLDVSEHGIVMTPQEDSVFLLKASDFRPGYGRADDRLLDGLVQVAIAATVYPRARDLEEDVNRPRPPLTVDEVEELLRGLCARFTEEAAAAPDPRWGDDEAGLHEAWRVYDARISARETRDDRQASNTTRRIIEYGLERLRDYGCFVETKLGDRAAWQPTRRYNVLVQELAASRLFEEVQRVLERNTAFLED